MAHPLFFWLFVAALVGSARVGAVVVPAVKNPTTSVSAACTAKEKWKFGGQLEEKLPREFRAEFARFLDSNDHPLRGFAKAQALGALPDPEAVAFSQYWSGRALWKAGLYGPAIGRFNAIVENPASPSLIPIQIAALACLVKTHEVYSVSVFSDKVLDRLPTFFQPGVVPDSALPTLWEAGLHLVIRRMNDKKGKAATDSALQWLAGAGFYDDYANAIVATAQGRPEAAEGALSRLANAKNLPPSIRRHQNDLRLVLARWYYQRDRYDDADHVLDLVGKQDNALVQALNLRSWIALARENFGEAIGTAISLQSGGLKETFAPDAFMVAAISQIETCQFPSALRTVGTFKKNYQTSYNWLKRHSGENVGPLYARAAAFLRGDAVDVPERIVSEWIRSPAFIRHQQAINLSFAQSRAILKLQEDAEQYVAEKAIEIQTYIATAEENDLESASELLQENDIRQPADAEGKIRELRDAGRLQEQLNEALPKWNAELSAYDTFAMAERERLKARIETLFAALLTRMRDQLEDVVDNADLVEVETLNAASEDMVWQNAHPEVVKVPAAGRFDWKVSQRSDGTEEVWEDELGEVKVNLENLCTKKNATRKPKRRPYVPKETP